jgi:hypothetical protein
MDETAAGLWAAYVDQDYQAIPVQVRQQMDGAETLVERLFGISPANYVRAHEAPGKSVKLADVIAAVLLAMSVPDVATPEMMADMFARWAKREGILARVTEDQCADLARAFGAGFLSATAKPTTTPL